ncbi:MAG TPA: choice-of-anchor tandem repeat GloVer-containing protein [Bryobacteraceae bacterium]|nr:choice-of-anchor tandem repeat GloVer-containing protein [Bryobacteraceae bacterium]
MKRIVSAAGQPTWWKAGFTPFVPCATTPVKRIWWRAACAVFLLRAMTVALPAQTLTTLHRFDSADCGYPATALVQALDGMLYGTTTGGGTTNSGTIFEIAPGGTLSTLYSFCPNGGGSECLNGNAGSAPLVQATNGDLYGTTSAGLNGPGSVFETTPRGALTTVYSFGGTSGGGAWEPGPLIQASNGDFYGTTGVGGDTNAACIFGGAGCGTVFRITPAGVLTILHEFCAQQGCPDGYYPVGGLVQAASGDFYGTTEYGGANCESYPDFGCGTVFKITPGGTLTTLYSFCAQQVLNCVDGSYPEAGLSAASDGYLYGTTSAGGVNAEGDKGGTVFKIRPGGALTTLYSFCAQSGCADGYGPEAALIQATDGEFYGTTAGGGAFAGGTIFKVPSSGTLATVYSFCARSGCTDGSNPTASLVQDTSGEFYGTTLLGGSGSGGLGPGCGTVFSLSAGLGPFVETLPSSAAVGAEVRILGTGVTGATSVSFNGTAAAFEVVSASEITTTVPAGASSGEVRVVTPSGALSSNVPFRVSP